MGGWNSRLTLWISGHTALTNKQHIQHYSPSSETIYRLHVRWQNVTTTRIQTVFVTAHIAHNVRHLRFVWDGLRASPTLLRSATLMSYSVNQSVFKREQVRIVTTHLDAPNSFFSVVHCFRRMLWCVCVFLFSCFSKVTLGLRLRRRVLTSFHNRHMEKRI